MKYILYILFLFFSLGLFAQGEANIWYFGENAGLDFNDCAPFAIDDGELNTVEGCSTFSDPNGNLLFYSDGITVWNRNHIPMPNGENLLGDPSSAQSAMIIPKPGSDSIYYIFTVDDVSGEDGFNYYTIDMDEDGGLGDVIEGPIDLSEGRGHEWSEKVAAVKGADGNSFWVLTYVPNEFRAYKVTKEGVNKTSIKSPSFAAKYSRGYLKFSPDGTKVAIAHEMEIGFLLYDFDDATGHVTNELNLPLITEGNIPYGVEFSSNSEKLYVVGTNFKNTTFGDPDGSEEEEENFATLFQFDVSLSSDAAIINSRVIIHESNLFRGALQLGPDKKIYRTLAYSYTEGIPQLGVIKSPNNAGAACDYKHASVGLLGRLSTQGLPPFIASIFSQIQIIGERGDGTRTVISSQTVGVCEGDSLDVFSNGLSGFSGYKWFYNGATTPFSTDAILQFNNITTANNGSYRLEVLNIDFCGNKSTLGGEFIIDVQDFPDVVSPVLLNNCDVDGTIDGITDFNLNDADDQITIGDSDFTVSYYLSFADADAGSNVLNPSPFNNSVAGTVYARVENEIGCHNVATVNLQVSSTTFPVGYLGEEITICDNDDTIDGLHIFDLSSVSGDILSQFTAPNLSVHYYESLTDAQLSENEIISQTDYLSTTPFSQTIYVRVESNTGIGCFGIGPYLRLFVNPRPEFEVDPTAFICLNVTAEITLETFNAQGDYLYEWRNESGAVISIAPTATVSSGGVYTVIAISDMGCVSFPQTVDVLESDVAQISLEDISITDDSENNTITIDTSDLGVGDYEFSLDNETGFYQDEPYFEMVVPGIHILFVRDKNGCGTVQLEVPVIGFPKFFTPNNDGYNDNWQILGVSKDFHPTSLIYIYDRFGKIIAKVNPISDGWNGYYNGEKALATDYWFSVQLTDQEGVVKERKGHFSLVRR